MRYFSALLAVALVGPQLPAGAAGVGDLLSHSDTPTQLEGGILPPPGFPADARKGRVGLEPLDNSGTLPASLAPTTSASISNTPSASGTATTHPAASQTPDVPGAPHPTTPSVKAPVPSPATNPAVHASSPTPTPPSSPAHPVPAPARPSPVPSRPAPPPAHPVSAARGTGTGTSKIATVTQTAHTSGAPGNFSGALNPGTRNAAAMGFDRGKLTAVVGVIVGAAVMFAFAL